MNSSTLKTPFSFLLLLSIFLSACSPLRLVREDLGKLKLKVESSRQDEDLRFYGKEEIFRAQEAYLSAYENLNAGNRLEAQQDIQKAERFLEKANVNVQEARAMNISREAWSQYHALKREREFRLRNDIHPLPESTFSDSEL